MENRKSKTAVVILNWNGRNYLKEFLPSLIKYSEGKNRRLIVADNGSEDDSVAFVRTNYPQIELIEFDKNYGFTGGYNKALMKIDADYFVLLNSDVELTESWLDRPIEIMENDKSVAAVAPKIKAYMNKSSFEYAGAAGGYIDRYGYPFCRGRILAEIEDDKGEYDDEREIFWASGACLFIRADLYKKNNGLDDDFFAHMEEIDLCWRMQNQNYKIVYTPKSIVYHVGGGTLPNNNPKKLYLNYRNNLLLLYKNLPDNKLVLTIFIRLILDGLSAMIYLVGLNFSFFAAVWKAHLAFYKLLPKFKRKRKEMPKSRRALACIYPGSIIWQYYIKQNKSFDKLDFSCNN